MLSFRLFGYPINVQWMFWLLCILLGMGYLNEPGPEALGRFLVLTAVIFGSIIWHELGHAWARKKSGAAYSEITLHGFGGVCSGPGMFTRGQSIFISAAGPAATLLLSLLGLLLMQTPGMANPWVNQFAKTMFLLNIGLAVFNLLPILPFDGGRIFEALAGPKNYRIVVWTSLILSAALAVYALLFTGYIFAAAILGYIAYSNWQLLKGRRAGFP